MCTCTMHIFVSTWSTSVEVYWFGDCWILAMLQVWYGDAYMLAMFCIMVVSSLCPYDNHMCRLSCWSASMAWLIFDRMDKERHHILSTSHSFVNVICGNNIISRIGTPLYVHHFASVQVQPIVVTIFSGHGWHSLKDRLLMFFTRSCPPNLSKDSFMCYVLFLAFL